MEQPAPRGDAHILPALPAAPKRRKFREVLRPRPQGEVRALLTSDRLTYTRSHYHETVSYKCIGPENGCPFCAKHNHFRVKGWLAALELHTGREVLVELTEGAIRAHSALRDNKGGLRGKILVVRRPGKTVNAPVRATLESCYQASLLATLPAPFNVQEAIDAMWELPQQLSLFDPAPGQPRPGFCEPPPVSPGPHDEEVPL